MIVCLVTPTPTDGIAVTWYRSEIAAEQHKLLISATRDGVHLGEYLVDGEVPPTIRAAAERAHDVLRQGGSADHLADLATHVRCQLLGSTIRPVGDAR